MFKQNKYTIIYYLLISKYKTTHGERHHIIPKSLGGGNECTNIVCVPARVHYILHKLLPKMVVDNTHKQKMNFALWRMMNQQTKHHDRTYAVNSREYNKQRENLRSYMSGSNNPMKNPETAAKFKRKRPEQSLVAVKRNLLYWEGKKLPTIEISCGMCNDIFTTNKTERKYCSKSCSAKYNARMRRLG